MICYHIYRCRQVLWVIADVYAKNENNPFPQRKLFNDTQCDRVAWHKTWHWIDYHRHIPRKWARASNNIMMRKNGRIKWIKTEYHEGQNYIHFIQLGTLQANEGSLDNVKIWSSDQVLLDN